MSTMSLEEVHQRLKRIPAKKFGCEHETCAIGQLHHILTGELSGGFDGNVYPEDVAMVVAELNDVLFPEDRKALAMMMPLPQDFPVLTKVRAIKLALWAGEQALGYYDGPDRAVLEQAVALAKRAAAGEPYTEDEVTAASVAAVKTILKDISNKNHRVVNVIMNMVYVLLKAVWHDLRSAITGRTVCDMARVIHLTEDDWRPWLAEYLKVRTEA